jgi:hypothetical protein
MPIVISGATITSGPQQNVSGTSDNIGFFPYGWPAYSIIQPGWTCVQTGAVVTVVDAVNLVITTVGTPFASGSTYTFTGPTGVRISGGVAFLTTPPAPPSPGSAQFSGSNNLSVPNSASLNPGTGDFTIEFWTRLTSTTNNASFYRGNNNGVDIFMNGSGRLAMGQAQVSTLITDTVTMTTGAWVHVAAVRIGSTTRLYKNGVQVGAAGDARNYVTDSVNYIGTQGGIRITGYISNLRVVIGLGVYTGAFTPPTAPLTVTQSSSGSYISAITAGQTQLLLNTTNDANFLKDGSINNITITNNGGVVSSALNPF